MNGLRLLVASLLLACFAAQLDLGHEHHCLIEKSACGTCRVVATPLEAGAPLAATLHIVCDLVVATPPSPDVPHACTALRDAFRLRAPPAL